MMQRVEIVGLRDKHGGIKFFRFGQLTALMQRQRAPQYVGAFGGLQLRSGLDHESRRRCESVRGYALRGRKARMWVPFPARRLKRIWGNAQTSCLAAA